jgi:hypothetical protein
MISTAGLEGGLGLVIFLAVLFALAAPFTVAFVGYLAVEFD